MGNRNSKEPIILIPSTNSKVNTSPDQISELLASSSVSSSSSTTTNTHYTNDNHNVKVSTTTVSFRSSNNTSTNPIITILERYKDDLADRHEYTSLKIKELAKLCKEQNHDKKSESKNGGTHDPYYHRLQSILSDILLQLERTYIAYKKHKAVFERYNSSRLSSLTNKIYPLNTTTIKLQELSVQCDKQTIQYYETIGKEGGIVYILQVSLRYLSNIFMIRLCLSLFIRLLTIDQCSNNRKLFIIFNGIQKLSIILQTYTFTKDIVEKIIHLKYLAYKYECMNSNLPKWLPWLLSGKLFYPWIISWYIYITVPNYKTIEQTLTNDSMRIAMWEDDDNDKDEHASETIKNLI